MTLARLAASGRHDWNTFGHVSVGPVTVTSSEATIVIPWKENWEGLSDCQAPEGMPIRDCASDRVLTFAWSRSCAGPESSGVGLHCD